MEPLLQTLRIGETYRSRLGRAQSGTVTGAPGGRALPMLSHVEALNLARSQQYGVQEKRRILVFRRKRLP